MLKVVFIAVVVVGALYFLVANTNIEAMGFRELKDGQPDTVLGVVAIILTLAVMAYLLFAPPREGTTLSSRAYLFGFACLGLVWGLDQLRRSKQRRRHRSQ